MGRPVKNNADYFPHFTTMRNHRKVKALRNRFGQVQGYAFWCMICEYLTDQEGNMMENSDLELEMFSAELGVSVTETREMLSFCHRIKLLFTNEANFIYSESLNALLAPVYEKRFCGRNAAKTSKRSVNGAFLSQKCGDVGISVTETPQSRVEYIKEIYKENLIEEKLVVENGLDITSVVLHPGLLTDDHVKERQKKIFDEALGSQVWIESNMRSLGLSERTVKELIKTFLRGEFAADTWTRPFSEIKKHFAYWAKKQNQKTA